MQTTVAAGPGRSLDSVIFFALALYSFSVIFSVTVVQAALFLIILCLILIRRRSGTLSSLGRELAGHELFLPSAVYLGVCLLTALTAYYPAKGLAQFNSDFLKIACLFALFSAVGSRDLPRLSAAYILAAFAAAVIGITEVAASGWLNVTPRANAFMNAVRYGEVMTIALMLALSRVVIPSKESFGRERLFYLLSAAFIFAALVLSKTRGAWLGAAVGTATMIIFSDGRRKAAVLCAASLLLFAGLLAVTAPSLRLRLRGMLPQAVTVSAPNDPATGVSVRLELWKLGVKMLRTHPALGVGPGNVRKVFKKFHPGPFPEEGIYGTLNSLYIQHAAERGLLGLGALLLLFAAFFRFARGRFRATRSPYALWALCALPAYYAANLTEISFQHVHTSFAIFLALAFAAASEKEGI